MENKLVSMTDFVLNQRMTSDEVNAASFQQIQNHIALYYDKVFAYATFLKQPLTLSMFVPVDDEGNVVSNIVTDSNYFGIHIYEKACEKVLFEGFGLCYFDAVFNVEMGLTIDLNTFQFMVEDSLGVGGGDIWGKTLEALAYTDLQLPLTPSALKLIGVKE